MVFMYKNNMGSASYKFNNTGSAILIVVLVMAALSLCCITFWQKSMLFYDFSLKRLDYEQKYRAAACGLDYAISVCSSKFNSLDIGQFEIETEEFGLNESGQSDSGIKYKCKIYINKSGHESLGLKSVLLDSSSQNVFEIGCNLILLKDANLQNQDLQNKSAKKLVINNWKICAK